MRKMLSVMFGLAVVVLSSAAFAAEEAVQAAASSDTVRMYIAIAAGFGMAIASAGGALSQSKAIATAVDGIARNPGAAGKIFAPTLIVGLALIESLVLLSFVVANGLVGKF